MEVLALKWNNYQRVFAYKINELRQKSCYTDATIACHGRFYNVHKFVLSICSDYFNSIFTQTSCRNPVIIIKDINFKDIEYLLDYMYTGEVNVRQNELASLITSAENLQIKGLAVSDEIDLPVDKDCKEMKVTDNIHAGNLSGKHCKQKHDRDCNLKTLSSDDQISKVTDTNFFNKSKSKEIIQKGLNSSLIEDVFIDSGKMDIYKDVPTVRYEKSPKHYQETFLPANEQIKTEVMDLSDMESRAIRSNTETSNIFPEYNNFSDESSSMKLSAFRETVDDFEKEEFVPRLREDDVNYLARPDLNEETFGKDASHFSGKIRSPNFYKKSQHLTSEDNIGSSVKKDYKCSYCGRAFAYKTNQLAHERIHTGVKPFHCLFCPLKTALKGNLKNHIMTRHKTDWKSVKHLIYPLNDAVSKV